MCKVRSCCGIPLRCASLIVMLIGFVWQFVFFTCLINYAIEKKQRNAPFQGQDKVKIKGGTLLMIFIYVIVGMIGVLAKKPGWMKKYLAIHLVFLLVFVGAGVLVLTDKGFLTDILLEEYKSSDLDAIRNTTATVLFVAAGIYYYFFIIVLSYYRKLRGLENAKKRSKQMAKEAAKRAAKGGPSMQPGVPMQPYMQGCPSHVVDVGVHQGQAHAMPVQPYMQGHHPNVQV